MNKGMLTACYNRKCAEDIQPEKQNRKNNAVDIGFRPKKLSSRSWVVATKVAKANNYDIVRYSQKMYNLQCKYNTSDFDWIAQQEQAVKVLKSYKKYTIKELMDMITEDNEPIIMKAIERIIDDERKAIAKAKAEEKAIAEQESEKLKQATRKVSVNMLSGLACSPDYNRIYQAV